MQCALCQTPAPADAATGRLQADWVSDDHATTLTGIALVTGWRGSHDREAGRRATVLRLCPTCFLTRLGPWLSSHGVLPEQIQHGPQAAVRKKVAPPPSKLTSILPPLMVQTSRAMAQTTLSAVAFLTSMVPAALGPR
jgi:hypothetical protein